MSLLLTNYNMSQKILDTLDKTYELKLRNKLFNGDLLFKSNKVFIYANILNILNMHNNLDKRIIDKIDIIKEKSISYIKKNNYNKEYIILMISLITSVNIYKKTEGYFESIKEYDDIIFKRDIDYIYNNTYNFVDPTKSNLSKTFDKAFNITYDIYDFIKYILNEGPLLPIGDRIFEYYLNKFKNILSISNINKLIKKYNIYAYTKNTCVSDSFIKSPIYNDLSFIDLIDEIYNDTLIEINKYLDLIFK